MAYITISNAKKIIQKIDEFAFKDIIEEVYSREIYCLSSREIANLKGIRELFKDLDNFILVYYKPIKIKDSYRYVTPENQPSYHKDNNCERLTSNFLNIEIPLIIREEGVESVLKFREWYKSKNFKDHDAEYYINELTKKFPQVGEINPKSIEHNNSGVETIQDYSLFGLEKEIDKLLKDSDDYFTDNPILRNIIYRYQKMTFLAYIDGPLKNNRSGMNDQELKEFLKSYDAGFKTPLKNRLIEYFKIKLNPEMEFKGFLLEQLGFRPCSFCFK